MGEPVAREWLGATLDSNGVIYLRSQVQLNPLGFRSLSSCATHRKEREQE